MRSRGRLIGLALLLVLTSFACTETDDQLVDDIGVTRLFLVDPGLTFQSVSDPGNGLQWAQWKLNRAELEFGGVVVDLLFGEGETCTVSDTVLISPFLQGPCSGGIVVNSGETADVRLTLGFDSYRVARAGPVELGAGDFDGDGVPDDGDGSGSHSDNPCGLNGTGINCDDNCPLVPNPDQTDTNEDGVGSACSTVDPFTGGQIADSDGDGVADTFDNCVWVANPGQEDTGGLADDEIPDLIGDACVEEEISVSVPPAITLGPIVLDQGLNSTGFLVVNVSSAIGGALACNFDTLICTLNPAEIGFCSVSSISEAVRLEPCPVAP